MAKANNMMRDFLLAAHPVGSYYWSSEATSPATLFGGTWEAITDKFVYAAGSKTVGTTGGSDTIPTSRGESTPLYMDGNTSYPVFVKHDNGDNNTGIFLNLPTMGISTAKGFKLATTQSLDNISTSMMPPYIVAYCWRRTA
jgi:hypothetical protein